MLFLLILGFAAVSSAFGYLYGKGVIKLSNRDLSTAGKATLECVWLTLVFFIINLLVAVLGILVSRLTARGFISLYDVSDITLLIISLFQGVVFLLWRRETADLER